MTVSHFVDTLMVDSISTVKVWIMRILCASSVATEAFNEAGHFYNYKSCTIEEYEGRLIKDNDIIPGMQKFWYWKESDKQDWEIVWPEMDSGKNPRTFTIKFSYTFDSPQTMTLEVENYIVTLFDLIGIVGGTLGIYIGFAFYDNILATVEYLIMIVIWAKRITRKKIASKVSDKKSSNEEKPKEEMPKKEPPKQKEVPNEKTPKQEMSKNESPKQKEEIPKEETPKEEMPKEETPKEDIPKEETTKNTQFMFRPEMCLKKINKNL